MSRLTRFMVNYLLIAVWIAQIIIAVIFIQSLFFKFSGAEESKYIFSKIGVEPWGRYLTGVAELVVAVMLLIPAISLFGSIGAIIIIVPAILLHLTILGIPVMNDKGLLFGLAMAVLILSSFVTWARITRF